MGFGQGGGGGGEKEDKRQVLEGTFLHRPVDVPPSSLSSLTNIVGKTNVLGYPGS